jgi:alginate O-acetyltransferase complex protein AlgI
LPLAYAISGKMPRERYLGLRSDKVIYLLATSVTFFLCGFWHGAAWTFIAWGIFHGIFIILDRLFLLKYLKKTGKIPSIVITFFILTIGWVIFRCENLMMAISYIETMFSFRGADNGIWLNPKFWSILFLGMLFGFWGGFGKIEKWIDTLYDKPQNGVIMVMSVMAILLFILNEATVTSTGFNPFIYFRF